MEKRLEFAYGRTLILNRIILVGGFVALLAVAIALLPPLPPAYVIFVAALLAASFVLFAISPLLTDHWLTRSRLILRQGWYFRAVLLLSEITSLEAAEDRMRAASPLGVHRPLGHPTLFVTGGRSGLVAVHLAAPRRFWQSFGLAVTEIVFDVADVNGFLAAFEERRQLLAPVEAHGADA